MYTVHCGFGIKEIADAFLTTKEVIYKRLQRAKERLKVEKIRIAEPSLKEIDNRLDNVLRTLYLLFTEGYYSTSQDTVLRMDLCDEAMRLNYLLIENVKTNKPTVNALFSIMCFHSSRFSARVNYNNELILYKDQDETLWDKDLILMGEHYLNQASQGEKVTKFHIEAAIAFWHTNKHDTIEKWESILQLYNKLLQIEYSPVIALNQTFALAKANGKKAGIIAAEKLELINDHFYYSLLGDLYTDIDNMKAMQAFQTALLLASSDIDKKLISNYINQLVMKEKDKP